MDQIIWRTTKGKDGKLYWKAVELYDYKEEEKKLNLEEKAHTFGIRANKVESDNALTPDERTIISDVNAYLKEKLDDFLKISAGQIKADIVKLSTNADVTDVLDTIEEKFCTDTDRARADFLREHQSNITARDRAERNLISFQIKNHLKDKSARYPESKIFQFAIIFSALIGEAIVNSYFFAQGSNIGLLGGLGQAALFSLANIIFSFVVGLFCLRYINHISKLKKTAGWFGFIIGLFFLSFLHLAIAHYREILMSTNDAETEVIKVIGPLLEHPFGLQDVESLILILIGVVISGLSMYEGYTFDDPYPGYGDVWRDWKFLDDAIVGSIKDLKLKIATMRENVNNEIPAHIEKWSANKKELQKLSAEIMAFFDCMGGYYSHARNGAEYLIRFYRNIIQKINKDHTKFPFSVDLLDDIQDIDYMAIKSEIENILVDEINNYEALINDIRQKKKELSKRLSEKEFSVTNDNSIKEATNVFTAEIAEEKNRQDEIRRLANASLKS